MKHIDHLINVFLSYDVDFKDLKYIHLQRPISSSVHEMYQGSWQTCAGSRSCSQC